MSSQARTAAIKELLGDGAWEEAGDCYLVHNYHRYQPTRARVEAEREAGRRRKARQRGPGQGMKPQPGEKQSGNQKGAGQDVSAPSGHAGHPAYVTPGQEGASRVTSHARARTLGSDLLTKDPDGSLGRLAPPATAQELVTLYVEQCRVAGSEPTRRAKQRIGAEGKDLLADGKPAELIAAAVRVVARDNKPPNTLPYVVGDLERGRGPKGRAEPRGFEGIREFARKRGLTP
jgi:hypothetical protein